MTARDMQTAGGLQGVGPGIYVDLSGLSTDVKGEQQRDTLTSCQHQYLES